MGSLPIPAPPISPPPAHPRRSVLGGRWHTQHEQGRRSRHGRFPHLPYLVQQGSAAAHGHQGLNTRVPRDFPAVPAGVGGQGSEAQCLPTIPPFLSPSAGLSGSPPCRCKAAKVETAQAPDPDAADMQNWGVLGEDNPQAPGPRLDKGCPLCS